MPKVRITATIEIDTDEVGIDIPADDYPDPNEEDVCDVVYAYFQGHADELADLIKQQCDEMKDYQDTVEVDFVEWDA